MPNSKEYDQERLLGWVGQTSIKPDSNGFLHVVIGQAKTWSTSLALKHVSKNSRN